MYGSSSGPDTGTAERWDQDSQGLPNVAEAGDAFGAWLSVGDYDGSGYSWLAIGVPLEDLGTKIDAGALHVLPGAIGGLSGSGSLLFKENTAGIPGFVVAGDQFGHVSYVAR